MLSGLEIKRQVELGNIVISNFNEKQLNPNSYNIKLGKRLKVYTKAITPSNVIEDEMAAEMQEYEQKHSELLNELFYKQEEELSDELSEKATNFMREYTLKSEEVRTKVIRKYALDPKQDNETEDFEIPEEGYVLLPGILYLGETEEYTETYGFIPNIDGRSSTGRLGIEIHRTAGFGDVGFRGKWTLEITVTHPVVVYAGMEIGQLYYETVDGDASMEYNGKYQDQQGVQAAKVDRE